MSKFEVDAITKAIKSCNHEGVESKLQCTIGKALYCCYEYPPCEFSPNKKRSMNQNKKSIGLEFGFWPNNKKDGGIKKSPRFIDLASVNWGVATGDEPTSINWLCEVKVIDPKRYTYKGRWYPYMFQYQCYPPMFDFRQPADSKFKNKFITDADEGQIIFDFIKMMACRLDFIKMMACRQKINLNARMYQILAIKNHGSYDFNYWKNKLISLLDDWGEWCGVKVNDTLQIYEWEDFVTKEHGKQEIALQCKLEGVTGCAITDLGSSNEYQHILIDWQPEDGKSDFAF